MKKQSVKDRSKKSEKQVAKMLGGRVQPASGALPVLAFKRDVSTKHLLVEDKTTLKSSYSVKKQDWEKLRAQAILLGKKPVYSVNFEQQPARRVFVIDEALFVHLMNLYELDRP